MEIIELEQFAVIGKLGSTKSNNVNFIKELINEANSKFEEIKFFAKDDVLGEWGLMSSFNNFLAPWDNNFSEGMYLFGVEAKENIAYKNVPKGWTIWLVPKNKYARIKIEDFNKYKELFNSMVYFTIPYNGYELSGAAFDYHENKTNSDYIYFPIKKTDKKIDGKFDKDLISYCGIHCGFCFFSSCKSCRGEHNNCCLAFSSPDKICPNDKCRKAKNLDGCYECALLEECKIGIYGFNNTTAKVCAMFIKNNGIDAYDKTIKNMIKNGINYSKDLDELLNDDDKYNFLKKYMNFKK